MRLPALLAFLVALPALGQTVQYPPQFSDNPNQVFATNGWLYLNKMHYAGSWVSTYAYNAQDLVFYGGASYISVQTGNLNNPPASSPGWWVLVPGSGSGAGSTAWGNILGQITNQLDLDNALNGKEPSIAGGTNQQFWRGDKTWQLPPVVSFNARTGAIVPQGGDYSTTMVTEGSSLYFTNPRAIAAVLPALSATSPISYNSATGVFSCSTCGGATAWGTISGSLSSQSDLNAALNAKEPSIAAGTTAQFWRGDKTWQQPPVISFGSPARTGAIIPASGDYTTAQVTESGNLYFTNPRAVTAVLPALSASSPLSYNNTTGAFTCPGCGAYTGSGTGAVATTVSTVLQVTGRSLDFCTTVDGSTDNTTCLQAALNSLGVKYATLEIEPGSATSGNTAINYVCSKLAWGPASYGHIHILRGAETSCALPPKDSTHDIVNDNMTSAIPDQSLSLANYHSGAFYACTGGCGLNDLTITGTYTGSQSSTQLCVEISATGTNDTMSWGYSVPGNVCTGGGGPTTITGGVGIALTGTGLTATFAASTGHTAVSGSNGDLWLDLLFASTGAPGSLAVANGLHSAAVTALGLTFGQSQSPNATQGIFGESVTPGVFNGAGANVVISPGAGTGTGASGMVRVQSCPPGSSGSTQNGCVAEWSFSGVGLAPAGDAGAQTLGNASHRPNAILYTTEVDTLSPSSLAYTDASKVLTSTPPATNYASIVAGSVKDLNRTATLSNTPLLNSPVGLYNVSAYTASNSTVCTAVVTLGWHDKNGAQTVNVVASTATFGQGRATLNNVSGNISYTITITGSCSGGTGFDTQLVAEKLQ